MYKLILITSTTHDDNKKVELIFNKYEEATKYAKTMVEHSYSVKITKIKG